mmetsp:Transcript_14941/g.33463  ORF Transcript_14941/g.33463 Transcript_14941/m.33463 type:complete len:209 (-) Transcript_14941:288-914(-)
MVQNSPTARGAARPLPVKLCTQRCTQRRRRSRAGAHVDELVRIGGEVVQLAKVRVLERIVGGHVGKLKVGEVLRRVEHPQPDEGVIPGILQVLGEVLNVSAGRGRVVFDQVARAPRSQRAARPQLPSCVGASTAAAASHGTVMQQQRNKRAPIHPCCRALPCARKLEERWCKVGDARHSCHLPRREAGPDKQCWYAQVELIRLALAWA